MSEDSPNFTCTSFGRHPRVKSAGSVPYYMVFDHHGDIVYHHMAGAYHGGDGLRMIEWVDDLLKDTPAIYLGKEPFLIHAKLADQIASGKNLGTNIPRLEATQGAEGLEGSEELERLYTAVTTWRDRELKAAAGLLATRPSAVVAALKSLQKEVKRSELATEVDETLASIDKSPELKAAIAIEKTLLKQKKRAAKLKPCEACDRKGIATGVASCEGCRTKNRRGIEKMSETLTAAIEGQEGLPIAKTVKSFIASFGG